MKKLLSLVLTLMLTLALFAPAMAEEAAPKIVYEGFLAMRVFEGRGDSDPEAYAAIHDMILEDTGVDAVPVWFPYGAEDERRNLMIADDSQQLDIIMSGDWAEYADSGVIAPLNDLLEEYGQDILEAYSEFPGIWDVVTDPETGNIYGLPRTLDLTQYPVWVRQDWLDAVGMEQPSTIDELEAVLEAFYTQDPAGNGQTIPILLDLDGINYGLSGAFTEGGYGNWIGEDGRVYLPVLQEGYSDCIAKMAEWYEKGYIYMDSFNVDTTRINELIVADRVGTTAIVYSPVCINLPELQKINPEANYGYNPELSGDKGYAETAIGATSSCMMILESCENKEAAMTLLNWFMDKENFVSSYCGRIGIDWDWVDEEASTLIRHDTDTYDGEFYLYPNNLMIRYLNILNSADEEPGLYTRFLTEDSYRTSGVKYAGDYGVNYSTAKLSELAPNYSDIVTMIEEQTINFITGVRPMDEWDTFVNEELPAAGLEQVIDAYTQLYNEAKGL